MVLQLEDFTCEFSEQDFLDFCSEYYIPAAVHPELPDRNATIADFPDGKVGVYARLFEFANQRIPLSWFFCDVLSFYEVHISQLHCIGAAKLTNFEINCRLMAITPTLNLFRAFYHRTWSNGWVSFAKRGKSPYQCYTEKLDSLRSWREFFFWVDRRVFPFDFAFHTQGSLPRDERPLPGTYSEADAQTLNTNRIGICAYPEEFLVHMGISRNYFLPGTPTFYDENGRGGCSSFNPLFVA